MITRFTACLIEIQDSVCIYLDIGRNTKLSLVSGDEKSHFDVRSERHTMHLRLVFSFMQIHSVIQVSLFLPSEKTKIKETIIRYISNVSSYDSNFFI